MKKSLMVLGVLACVVLLANPAAAGDCNKAKSASNAGSSCDKAAVAQASSEGATCSKSAAKAAYAKALDETGCEKTAKKAYNNTVAERLELDFV